ncbi:LytTR family DNA-binding domain-containing protein [uncultured Tenacibaculum sp.]|uniref:LytR/AlgR family response regulator transcription factor n=1 Tax=uncultured Tenacibaculum sp. TaxID=174713 RepID=UPI00261360D7|nr:LytTR family DNA-binding domain-containing protein [uncultured Tenacibaculum sp.]
MNCIIIEDNKNTVDILQDIIKNNFPSIKVLGTATSIEKGISILNTYKPDFIFLDINLDDGEGFSILKEFPKADFKIIFITSYSKYAIQAFKFSALDFILKPFTPNEICQAIDKVIENKINNDQKEKLDTFLHNYNSQSKKIVLSDIDHLHVVPIEEIIYASSENSYTIFTLKNKEEIVVSKSLKSFDEKLAPYSFIRIHQRYLINIEYVEKFHKKNEEILLSNKTILPVSKGKKEQLIQALKKL